MTNILLDKGIIFPSGEINKNKINLVAGAITKPFAEMVWLVAHDDRETLDQLMTILVTMNTDGEQKKLFMLIKMLYGFLGLPFSEEAEPMNADNRVLEYFIFSFIADLDDIIQDYRATSIR